MNKFWRNRNKTHKSIQSLKARNLYGGPKDHKEEIKYTMHKNLNKYTKQKGKIYKYCYLSNGIKPC